jgi:DNA transformation protein and related proteins
VKRPKKYDPDLEAILDQLKPIEDLRVRSMFGGYGLYSADTFFAIIADGKLYLKVSEMTREDFEAYGMKPFQPSAKTTLKRYYEIPPAILQQEEALISWVKQAIAVAGT